MARIRTNWQLLRIEGDQVMLYHVGTSSRTAVETQAYGIHYHFGGKEWILPLDARAEVGGQKHFPLKVQDAPELIQTYVLALVDRELQLLHGELKRAYQDSMLGDDQAIYKTAAIGPDPDGNFHLMVNLNGKVDAVQSFRFTQDVNWMLSETTFDNGCGARFNIERTKDKDIYHRQMDLPELYFRPGGFLRSHQKWEGIEEFGPFSGVETAKKVYQILILCPHDLRSSIEEYLGGLKHGLEDVRQGGEYPWSQGWSTRFHFDDWDYEFQYVSSYQDPDMKVQLEARLDRSESKFDLAMLACKPDPDKQQLLPTKATLLSWGVPFEELVLVKGISEVKRAFRIRETALRSYAKLGGRPWLLPQRKMLSHEVVIGIGSSELTTGTYGFSVLFSRDGLFHMGKSSHYPSREAWEEDLGDMVVRQIQALAEKGNWQDHDAAYLVFHLDDSLSWRDKQVVQNKLYAEFGSQFNLSMVFLRIGYRHAFRMWNLGDQSEGKSAYRVPCGISFQLDGERFLVQMGKDSHPGPPLLIERSPGPDPVDLEDLSWQVFRFSHLSYRDYDAGELPVTLEYGNRLATLLDQFYQAGLGEEVSKALRIHDFKTWFL